MSKLSKLILLVLALIFSGCTVGSERAIPINSLNIDSKLTEKEAQEKLMDVLYEHSKDPFKFGVRLSSFHGEVAKYVRRVYEDGKFFKVIQGENKRQFVLVNKLNDDVVFFKEIKTDKEIKFKYASVYMRFKDNPPASFYFYENRYFKGYRLDLADALLYCIGFHNELPSEKDLDAKFPKSLKAYECAGEYVNRPDWTDFEFDTKEEAEMFLAVFLKAFPFIKIK